MVAYSVFKNASYAFVQCGTTAEMPENSGHQINL